MKKQKDTSTVRLRSPQASLSETILQKLSTLEELIKKKDDKPLTFKEACAYLGYAPSYLYKLTYRKVIPHYKPTGKMIFFSKNEIDEWVYKSNVNTSAMLSAGVKSQTESGSTLLTTADPNQIEMGFDEKKGKRNEENNETEILIEFPLKSRRKK